MVTAFTLIVDTQFIIGALFNHFGLLGSAVRPLETQRRRYDRPVDRPLSDHSLARNLTAAGPERSEIVVDRDLVPKFRQVRFRANAAVPRSVPHNAGVSQGGPSSCRKDAQLDGCQQCWRTAKS